MSTLIMTPEFRVSWPQVFKPTVIENSGPRYRITMLFDKKTDLSAINKAIEKEIDLRWPDKKSRPSNLKTPLKDGDVEKENIPGYKNVVFASASNKMKPPLVDAKVQPILDESLFYPGCYARMQIAIYAYPKEGKIAVAKGVSFSIQAIQKTREGEHFGMAPTVPEDVFEVIANQLGADDPANYGDMLG